jgi:hypothetical protein
MGEIGLLHQVGDADTFQAALPDLTRGGGDDPFAALGFFRL